MAALIRVLTVNPGSHSLQLHLVETSPDPEDSPQVVDQRTAEHRPDDAAVRDDIRALLGGGDQVDAVAHRVVHGGPRLRRSALVSDDAELSPAQVREGISS